MKLEFDVADGYNFLPHCLNHLARYTGPLYNDYHDLAHPLAFVSTSLNDLIDKIEAFLNTLDLYKTLSFHDKIRPDTEQELLGNYKAVIYSFAEYAESLEKNVVKSICPKIALQDSATKNYISDFKKKISPKYDRAIVICNKLKHNHNRMNFVLLRYSIGSAAGFSVMHNNRGTWKPNIEIHKKCQYYSFNIDIRRIMAEVYLLGYECGIFINNIAQTQGGLSETLLHNFQLPDRYIPILSKISTLPTLPFPPESLIPIPLFRYNQECLKVSYDGGNLIPVGSLQAEIEVRYAGDGVSNSFAII